MRKLVRWIVPSFACAAVLAAGDTIPGPERPLHFGPAETKVEFALHASLHTVHGTFQLKRGALRFDAGNGRASGELVVDAGSGSSGNAARDRNMRDHVLESDRYPDIVFRPDRVEGKVAPQGPSHVRIHGTFTIHGAGHEITLPADVDANQDVYATTLHFTVPYQEWGMKNPSTLFLRVSGQVAITIHTVARPAPPAGKGPDNTR